MQRIHAWHAIVAAALFLAACGGGGGSSPAPIDLANPTFNSLVAESRTFYSKRNSNIEGNMTGQMPVAGRFTYQGTALLWTGDKLNSTLDKPDMKTIAAAGRLTMAADIAAGEVRGTVDQFRSAPGKPVVLGSVGLSGMVTGNSYVGDPSGQLNIGASRNTVTGTMIGHFTDDHAEGTAGYVSGNLNLIDNFLMTYTGER